MKSDKDLNKLSDLERLPLLDLCEIQLQQLPHHGQVQRGGSQRSSTQPQLQRQSTREHQQRQTRSLAQFHSSCPFASEQGSSRDEPQHNSELILSTSGSGAGGSLLDSVLASDESDRHRLCGDIVASIAPAGGLDFRVGEKILMAGSGGFTLPLGTSSLAAGSMTEEVSCTVCGKPFQHVDNLRQHMNAHLGVKPYSCRRCPFRTTHRVYLWRHERQHNAAGESGRSLISCSVCSTIFLSDYSRALHQRRCQGDVPGLDRKRPPDQGEPSGRNHDKET